MRAAEGKWKAAMYTYASMRPPIGLRDAWLDFFSCVNAWKRKKMYVNAWNDFHAWCVKSIKCVREFVKTEFFLRDFVKLPIFNPIFGILRENPNFPLFAWMRASEKMTAWLRDWVPLGRPIAALRVLLSSHVPVFWLAYYWV